MEHKEKIEELREENARLHNEIISLSDKNTELRNEVRALGLETEEYHRDDVKQTSKIAELESELSEAQNELSAFDEEYGWLKAKTLEGEQKLEILKKPRHLSLSDLETIEFAYASNILGFEQIID